MLAHSVYFTLKDRSQEAIHHLVEACDKYLTAHPGPVFYACGTLEPELARPVNDRDFDVSLLLVFKDRAAHDKYQTTERHNQFLAEHKESWKKVRIFDSIVG